MPLAECRLESTYANVGERIATTVDGVHANGRTPEDTARSMVEGLATEPYPPVPLPRHPLGTAHPTYTPRRTTLTAENRFPASRSPRPPNTRSSPATHSVPHQTTPRHPTHQASRQARRRQDCERRN